MKTSPNWSPTPIHQVIQRTNHRERHSRTVSGHNETDGQRREARRPIIIVKIPLLLIVVLFLCWTWRWDHRFLPFWLSKPIAFDADSAEHSQNNAVPFLRLIVVSTAAAAPDFHHLHRCFGHWTTITTTVTTTILHRRIASSRRILLRLPPYRARTRGNPIARPRYRPHNKLEAVIVVEKRPPFHHCQISAWNFFSGLENFDK